MARRLTCWAVSGTVLLALAAPGFAASPAPLPVTVYSVDPAHSLGLTVRSSVANDGTEASGASSQPGVDADGEVVFASTATDLGPTVSGGHSNVFLRTATGATILISRTSGGVGGDGDSDGPVIAAGGRIIVFHSLADDLVSGDNGAHGDVFLYNRDPSGDGLDGPDRLLSLVSRSSTDVQGDGDSDQPALAVFDGTPYIAFRSAATNLVSGDTNGKTDVFLRYDGTTARASLTAGSAQITSGDSSHPAIAVTTNVAHVAFQSSGDGVTTNDANGFSDVFVRTMAFSPAVGTTELVSYDWRNVPAANGASSAPSISDDGDRIAFQSDSPTVGYYDPNNTTDVFVRNVTAGTTELVSWSRLYSNHEQTSNAASTAPAISGNGRFVAFVSRSTDLGATDSNAANDVYEYQEGSPIVVRLSQSSSDAQSDAASSAPALATGGLYAAFASDAGNLVGSDTNGVTDVFRRLRDADAPVSLSGSPDAQHVVDGATWSSNIDITTTVHAAETGDIQSGVAGYYWQVLLPGDPVTPLDPMAGTMNFTEGSSAILSGGLRDVSASLGGPSIAAQLSGPVRFEARALDRAGNLGPVTLVGPYLIDLITPKVTGKAFPQGIQSTGRTVTLTWNGTDALSGVSSYDVYYWRYVWKQGGVVETKHYLARRTHKTKLVTAKLVGGATYVFHVGAYDKAGNYGEGLIGSDVLPTSVSHLRFSSDWTRSQDPRFLRGAAVTATKPNASFKVKVPSAGYRLAMVKDHLETTYTLYLDVTTCPTCGKVAVLVHLAAAYTTCLNPDGTPDYASPTTCQSSPRLVRTRYKSVSLYSATIKHSKLLAFHIVLVNPISHDTLPIVPDYTQVFVNTSGQQVVIEALASAPGKAT